MIKVGLSGNRYSGKDRVVNLFKQIGIPVFNADVVIKFILNYDYEIMNEIKDKIGSDAFIEGKLNSNYVINNKFFDKILNIIEPKIFNAYEKFEKQNTQSIYTIFLSSILFERDWNKKMNYTISVFAPKNERIKRAKYLTDIDISSLHKLSNSELDELVKNKMADFVIHNYDSSIDSLDDVCLIDKKIIDNYLNILRNEKNKIQVTF